MVLRASGYQSGLLVGWYRSFFTGHARLMEDSREKGGQKYRVRRGALLL
jgi:hypothetical protein